MRIGFTWRPIFDWATHALPKHGIAITNCGVLPMAYTTLGDPCRCC